VKGVRCPTFSPISPPDCLLSQVLDQSDRVRVTKPHLGHIITSTRGIIFLGTPHRGSGMASLAAVMSSIIGVVMRTNANLVRNLERESGTLDQLRDSFSQILANGTLSVWSFAEALAMPGTDRVCPFVRRRFAHYSLLLL
jgi:hypothetical protein